MNPKIRQGRILDRQFERAADMILEPFEGVEDKDYEYQRNSRND